MFMFFIYKCIIYVNYSFKLAYNVFPLDVTWVVRRKDCYPKIQFFFLQLNLTINHKNNYYQQQYVQYNLNKLFTII